MQFLRHNLESMCICVKSLSFFHDKTSLGVAVGAGWQSLVAYINIGCYYVFGLPAGIVLGFVLNFGVEVMYHSHYITSSI